jgi:hypothetical protein
MENLSELPNNQLLLELKQLENDHEAIKTKMLNDYNKMVEIEEKYSQINKLLLKRIKG